MQKKNRRGHRKVYQKPEINEVRLNSEEPVGAIAAAAGAILLAPAIIPTPVVTS